MKIRVFYIFILLMAVILSACSRIPQDETAVWIDVPVDRLTFDELQAIKIKGHATAPESVERVDIYINDTLLTTISDLEQTGRLASYQTTWTPADYGIYMIMAFAFGSDGSSSEPDLALVTFSKDVVVELSTTEVTTPTLYTKTIIPSITPSPEDTVTDEVSVEFWADPLPVPAGGCTTIYWEAQGVSNVIFGGVAQPMTGSYRMCGVCQEQNYRLVVTHLDESEETLWVNITISGTCATMTLTMTPIPTPTPTPWDNTPPPIPAPYVPADGLSLSCRSSQALTWLPVTDPSGIREYRVEVQRSSDNSIWNIAPGSPIHGILEKTTQISVECGWYYRWHVQAVDGAGNICAWSSWSYFSITLE